MKERSIVITCHHNGKAASPLIQEEMLLSYYHIYSFLNIRMMSVEPPQCHLDRGTPRQNLS